VSAMGGWQLSYLHTEAPECTCEKRARRDKKCSYSVNRKTMLLLHYHTRLAQFRIL